MGEADVNWLRGFGVVWGGRWRFVIDGGDCKLETTGLTRRGVMSLSIKMGQTKLLVVMADVLLAGEQPMFAVLTSKSWRSEQTGWRKGSAVPPPPSFSSYQQSQINAVGLQPYDNYGIVYP